MLIAAILIALMMGTLFLSTWHRVRRENINMMRGVAEGQMKPPEQPNKNHEMNLPFFKVTLSPEGEPVSREGGALEFTDWEKLRELVREALSQEKDTGLLWDYELRYLVRRTEQESVIVFADVSTESGTIRHMGVICIRVGLLALLLTFLASIQLSRKAVRPVEEAWKQQKQFIGDASHELKTPLTVILTDTELLQAGEGTEEEKSHLISSMRAMAEQMRGLVEELLTLARADQPNPEREQQSLDLSRCISDATLPFEPVFYEKGLGLETDIEAGIRVKGNDSQLRQVTEILLDNAQKYCAPATTTDLTLKRQGRAALLTVTSRGEEIEKEELEKIFLRFYRKDKARSMNHSYGLGLAIANQIVKNHRGKIWAESGNGCNKFFVRLPCE